MGNTGDVSAIKLNKTANTNLSIINSTGGLINYQNINSSNSAAISLSDTDGGSTFSINNLGLIRNNKAIEISGTGNDVTIENGINAVLTALNKTATSNISPLVAAPGAIYGSIAVNGNNTTINNEVISSSSVEGFASGIFGNISSTTGNLTINNISGSIVGDISTTSGELSITNSSGSLTGNINLGSNAASFATFSTGSGTITSNITLGNAAQIINLGNIDFRGTISGADAVFGLATINIIDDLTLTENTGNFGTANSKIRIISIDDGKTLTLSSSNIYFHILGLGDNSTLNLGSGGVFGGNFSISMNEGSVINFGNSNKTLNSFIVGDDGVLNFGSGSHIIDGNITTNDTTYNTTISSLTVSGNIIATGTITTSVTALNVTLPTSLYIKNSASYTILSGADGSDFNNGGVGDAVSADKINVNGSSSNTIGLITFTTEKTGNTLVLNAARNNSYNPSQTSNQGVFNALVGNLDSPTGELLTATNYLLLNNLSNDARDSLLDSLSSNNTGINQATYNATTSIINSIENRTDSNIHAMIGDNIMSKINDRKYLLAQAKSKNAIDGFYSNDISKNFGVWAQVIGSSAKQQNKTGFNGYNSNLSGITFGGDKKIDKNTVIGAGFGISDTAVKSTSGSKRTDISSYQLNAYGSKNLDGYFVDAFAAVTLNRYESRRYVNLVGKTASADYNGNTYLAKIKGSKIKELGNKLELIPEIGLLFAHNALGNYRESGAGTLNLIVQNKNSNMLEGTIGAGLRYNSFEIGDNKIVPKIKISYGYDFIGNKQTSTANFIGQNASFDTQSSKINRQVLRFETGLDIYSTKSVQLSANYMLERKSTYKSHLGLLRARYEF